MHGWIAALIAASVGTAAAAAPTTPDLAAAFGARPAATGMAISPAATRALYIAPTSGSGTGVVVVDLASGKLNLALSGKDTGLRPVMCRWKTESRFVCRVYGVSRTQIATLSYSRVVAVNADGGKMKLLGQRSNVRQVDINQNGGNIIDYLPDDPDHVLMQITVAAEEQVGSHLGTDAEGVSAQRVDINTGNATMVESPNRTWRMLATDGHGNVRLMASGSDTTDGYLREQWQYFTRGSAGDRKWRPAGTALLTANATLEYDGFDESGDNLYALKPLAGRQALYKIAADGSGSSALVFAHPIVDVDGVARIGKYRRPVAVGYTIDNEQYEFLDPKLGKLSRLLSKALPKQPNIGVLDESWDGKKLLISAERSDNPGTYYLYDVASRELNELLPQRPQLKALTLGTVNAVQYPAADGTPIPAYLTLPPGVPAKGLRTIVMPHGGPSARDSGGFDWLAQYFVQLGYAVLQPNFRGSSGYGEAWYRNNGFKSWATAMGDINDGARWLVAQGIADGNKLAIVGWSYGGYAALQANVLDPKLYKAAIAVAPVTDLEGLRARAKNYVNYKLVDAFIGQGPHVTQGSPARNAARIEAPVLLFSGDLDLNVDVSQSRTMAAALKAAGKSSELIVYPGLDHGLGDSTARTDLLQRSAAFLAANVK